MWVIKCLSFFLVRSWSSSTPFYPQSATNQWVCLDFLLFRYFHFIFTFKYKELGNASIAFTYSRQHPPHWMWLQVVWFYVLKRSFLLKYRCWKEEMVKHGRTMCIIAHHAIFPMWMARLTHLWLLYLLVYDVWCVGSWQELPLCWFMTGVQEDGTWHVWHRFSTMYQLANGFVLDAPSRRGSHNYIVRLYKDFSLKSPTYDWGFQGFHVGD
jgi:hypothetical protein